MREAGIILKTQQFTSVFYLFLDSIKSQITTRYFDLNLKFSRPRKQKSTHQECFQLSDLDKANA